MSRNKYMFIGIILLVFIFTFFINREITVYVGIANPSSDVDITLKIDGETILEKENIQYNPYGYKIEKVRVRGGLHKITVSTSKGGLKVEKRLIVFMNQQEIMKKQAFL
jgi:hypothetical protein